MNFFFSFCNFRNDFFSREIASRNPHSFATDVWSLGILIVTLLTGRPPFDTDSTSLNFSA
jgi:polo-like kinase 4